MLPDEAVRKIYDANVRLTPEAIDFLKGKEELEFLVERVVGLGAPLVAKEDIENIVREDEKIPLPVEVKRADGFKPLAAEHKSNFRVIGDRDVSGKSRCTGSLENFVEYFRDRFSRSRNMLRKRMTASPPLPLSKLKGYLGQKSWVIGMVADKRMTRKEDMVIEIEDEEAVASVFISKSEKCFRDAKNVLLDDVVAIAGKLTENFVIANEIIWPDMQVGREQKLCESDVCTVYLSDLHVGSKNFLEKEFGKFVSWLNGNESEKELAGKVKYLVIAGDVVDGIGIYPNQEKELVVRDIYKQYEIFDALMQNIPDYVEVIVAPGNHDAVRRGEPQPKLPDDMVKSRVVKVGNPSYVEIEGLKHLIYHGTSIDSVIASMSGLDYARPELVMLELLKRRNLSPIYGENPIIPEGRDYMVIDDEPDVVHMGHVHKNGDALYRGTLLVNSGTFQSRTAFQEKLGHVPSPALVPVYEMRTGRLKQLNFGVG